MYGPKKKKKQRTKMELQWRARDEIQSHSIDKVCVKHNFQHERAKL